jgi:hypothetical protein
MSYASYLSSCGVRKGEFSSFVMNKQEWKESIMTLDQKREVLNKRLADCQDAWLLCYLSGDKLISHAAMNEMKAYISLLRFEVQNGMKTDSDSVELLRIMCKKYPHF